MDENQRERISQIEEELLMVKEVGDVGLRETAKLIYDDMIRDKKVRRLDDKQAVEMFITYYSGRMFSMYQR